MNMQKQDRIKDLLHQTLPPTCNAEPSRDLWPEVLQRINTRSIAPPMESRWFGWPLFDCALLVGVALLVAVFPASIPVILYYL